MPKKTKDDELKVIEEKPKKEETKKKTTAKKSSTTKKTTTAKKSDTVKKDTATKKSTTAKKSTSTKKAKTAKKSAAKKTTPPVLEYYDLPYRYNETKVTVLAQNPHTLFVYWDIADSDRANFVKEYGDNFFNITKPVLIVHNLTDNYSYEIDINDFANNWYIHIDDSKCMYSVELGRRPRENNQGTTHEYLNISYSNAIEIPNDHILYFKDDDKIYFKNIKNNKITEKTFKNKVYGRKMRDIYKDYNISENEDQLDMQNPSSDFLSPNIL